MADYDYGIGLLSNGENQGLQDYGKIVANGKIADAFVKTNPEALDTLGMAPEQFGALSAQDKTSAITGMIQAQGAMAERQKTAAMIQEYASRAALTSSEANKNNVLTPALASDYASQAAERVNVGNWRTAQANASATSAKEDEDAGTFVKNFFDAQPDPNADNPFQDRISQALNMTPDIGGKSFNRALQLVTQYAQAEAQGKLDSPGAPTVLKDNPYPGVSIVQEPGGRGLHIVNDPSTAVSSLTDENGNPVPNGFVGRGGQIRFAPAAKQTDPSLIDERQQTALKTWHGRLDPAQDTVDVFTKKMTDPKLSPDEQAAYGRLRDSARGKVDQILAERPRLSAPDAGSGSGSGGAAKAPATPAAAGTQQQPHTPSNQADFDAIKSGEWFVNPKDGRVLQKK